MCRPVRQGAALGLNFPVSGGGQGWSGCQVLLLAGGEGAWGRWEGMVSTGCVLHAEFDVVGPGLEQVAEQGLVGVPVAAAAEGAV